MREILFRGKSKCDGTWTYGYLFVGKSFLDDSPVVGIISKGEEVYTTHLDVMYEQVIPETVGQWTGLVDRNGVKIFEGDVVEFGSHGYIPSTERGVVVFNEGCYGIEYILKLGFNKKYFHRIGKTSEWRDMGASGTITYTYEVIGNIHDNPELLEV